MLTVNYLERAPCAGRPETFELASTTFKVVLKCVPSRV